MLNKVILIGRLGRDPEVRYMPNGEAVCNFSIATDESWKDAQGQKQTRTEWHNITMYRKLAEIAGQHLKKGGLVYLEGKIQSNKYTDKNSGQERTAYNIVAGEMKMLGGRNDDSQPAEHEPLNDRRGNSHASGAVKQPEAPTRQAPVAPVQSAEDIDSDIPF